MPEFLRKRDGRVVPFSPKRITDAVARAQAAVGDGDPGLPLEVAELVVMTLISRAESSLVSLREEAPPTATLEEVQDLVEEALVALGHTKIAKAYILYRDRRSRAREALMVFDGNPQSSSDAPEVRGSEGTQAWQANRIAAALVREVGLSMQVADEVARRVEKEILSLGMSRISSGLVRAFVDQELQTMGLFDATRASEPCPARSARIAPGTSRRAAGNRRAACGPTCFRRASCGGIDHVPLGHGGCAGRGTGRSPPPWRGSGLGIGTPAPALGAFGQCCWFGRG
jgi:hypothetical protein